MKRDQTRGMDRRTFIRGVGLGAAAVAGASEYVSAQSSERPAKKVSAEKIDMYCHVLPKKYKDLLMKKNTKPKSMYIESIERQPALWDMDVRFKQMEPYPGLRQVLLLNQPPLEYCLSSQDAVDLARIANDEMAELMNKYPDRFVAAVAGLPLGDVDAALREMERAIKDLKFKGILLFNSVNEKPLDRPEFLPLYEKMARYDLPIWIHPAKDSDVPDYPGEEGSQYAVNQVFGWPYETTVAMARLAYSGILEKYPNLKFIIHHCGGMLPFYSGRGTNPRQPGAHARLTKAPVDYFKKFYGDTVLAGNVAALTCGYAFFGASHLVFGTDFPMTGREKPGAAIKPVIDSVEALKIAGEEKAMIFSGNARQLLHLA